MKLRRFVFALALLAPAVVLAHGGHKHVMGTVLSANAKRFVVKTADGDVTVPISNTTRFYHGTSTKQPATVSEVEEGMRVVAHLGADGKAVEIHIPEMASSQKVGALEGRIVSRDAARNELTVQHGEIKGIMAAMTMSYSVRGQKVSSLPKNGTTILAKLHEADGKYWLTDIRRK